MREDAPESLVVSLMENVSLTDPFTDDVKRAIGGYKTAVFTGPAGFELVREHWEDLAPHAQYYNQLPEWVENIAPEEICWFDVTEDDRPVAVAALSPRRVSALGKRIEFLGGVRLALDGSQGTDLALGALGVADSKADGMAIVTSVLGAFRESGARWDVLWLRMLRKESPWLALPFGDLGGDSGAPFVETTRPSDQFWAAASGNLKHALNKARRRLEREGRRSAVSEARRPGEVAVAFQDFVALEARGWKRDAGALANRPETAEFMRRFYVKAAAAGRIRIRSLMIDDCVAACQLSVQVQDTLFLTKIAYDEGLQHLSVGNLLLADLISKSCDDPTISRIDFGQWASWHDRWGITVAPRYRLVAFNQHSPTGLAAKIAWKTLGVVGKQPKRS